MIYPRSFCSNPDTLDSNAFQHISNSLEPKEILFRAQAEFTEFQNLLIQNGLKILKFEEDTRKFTPDAIFPNNWFCQLPDKRVFLFPMFPKNRREEARDDVVSALNATEVIDLRYLEKENIFLEGTGSLILDHDHKVAFACLSARTSPKALEIFSEKSGYKVCSFESFDQNGKPVYHSNVMMALSPRHAVLCLDSIKYSTERSRLLETLKACGKTIVSISIEEMNHFAGNMLFLSNSKKSFWICSKKAYAALTEKNREALESEATFLFSDLNTIETYGGGGARCLLAEYFDN